MKNLFTYPNNSGTSFTNPSYFAGLINATDIVTGGRYKILTVGTTDFTTVGSADNTIGTLFVATGTPTGTGTVHIDSTGFLGRFRNLVNSSYGGYTYAWPQTYNGATNVPNVIRQTSKFINYFNYKSGATGAFGQASRQLSMYDMFYNPLVYATKRLITSGADILSADVDTTAALITTDGAHGFADDAQVTLSGMDGSWIDLDGQDFYTDSVTTDTLKLRVGSGTGPLVRWYDLDSTVISSTDLLSPATITVPLTNPFSNGDLVDLSNFNGSYAQFNGQSFYVQNKTTTTLNLSYDSAGLNPINFNQSARLDQPAIAYRWGQFGDDRYLIDLSNFSVSTDPSIPQTIIFSGQYTSGAFGLQGGSTSYNLTPSGISNELYYVDGLTFANVLAQSDFLSGTTDYPTSNGLSWALRNNSSGVPIVSGPNVTDSETGLFDCSHDLTYGGTTYLSAGTRYYYTKNSSNETALYTDTAKTSQVDLSNFNFDFVSEIDPVNYNPFVPYAPILADDGTTDLIRDIPGPVFSYQGYIPFDSAGETTASYYYLRNSFANDIVPKLQSTITYNSNSLINDYTGGAYEDAGYDVDYWKTKWLALSANNGMVEFTLNAPGPSIVDDFRVYAYDSVGGGSFLKSPFATWIEASRPTNTMNIPILIVKGALTATPVPTYIFIKEWVWTGDITYGGATVPNGYYVISQYVDPANTTVEALPTTGGIYGHGTPFGTGTDQTVRLPTVNNQPQYLTGAFSPEGVAEVLDDNIWFDQDPAANVTSGKTKLVVPKLLGYTLGYIPTATWNSYQPTGVDLGLYQKELNAAPSNNNANPIYGKIKTGVKVNYNGTDYIAIRDVGSTYTYRYYNTSTSANEYVTIDAENWILYNIRTSGGVNWIPTSANAYPGDALAIFYPDYPVVSGSLITWDWESQYQNHWAQNLFTASVINDVSTISPVLNGLSGTIPNGSSTAFDVRGKMYSYLNNASTGYNSLAIVNNGTVAATSGKLVENFTAADAGQFARETLTPATTGSIGPASGSANIYEIDTTYFILPGAQAYTYKDASNVTQPGATVNNLGYWGAGDTTSTLYSTSGETPATFTTTVDSSGYLTNSVVSTRGAYADGEDILLEFQSLPDQYTPRTPTAAESEDTFDTQDQWADYGFASGLKKWPTHVTPSRASINYNTPTTVNKSQNGIKYARTGGFTKWTLEVDYPPMNKTDFQQFHTIAQLAQGQAMPFYFVMKDRLGNPILWKDFNGSDPNGTAQYYGDFASGSSIIKVSGFAGDSTQAFKEGEVFINGNNENGFLHTSAVTQDANAYGEAEIRLTMPLRAPVTSGELLYKNPAHVVVTLSGDDFTYEIDTNGYYYVSVSFDLDGWKD